MTNEEALLAFRKLNEEVEELRKSIKQKDALINDLQLTIMKLNQELLQLKATTQEQDSYQQSEASKSFL